MYLILQEFALAAVPESQSEVIWEQFHDAGG